MRFIKKILLFLFLFLAVLYLGFVFLLPHYLNSPKFSEDINHFLYKHFKLHYDAEGFSFKTKYNLRVSLDADKISLFKDFDSDGEIKNEEKLFYTENFHISTGTFKQKTVNFTANYLIFNSEYLKEILPMKKHHSKKARKTSGYRFFNKIDIKHAVLIFSNDKGDKFRFDISNLLLKKEKERSKITFLSEVSSELLKNNVKIGEEGELEIKNRSLLANNLSLRFGDANVSINGLIQDSDKNINFKVFGQNIPVDDLEASLLYFQKLRKKDKVFIENFYDWGGVINVDLEFNNAGVFGRCKAVDLFAKSRLFDVPILFKEGEFVFHDREVTSFATGTLGFDKVISIFKLTNMATKNQTVEGIIQSDLRNQTVSTYVPHTRVKEFASAEVKYHVQNHIIDVDYSLNIKQGANLYFKDANLGLENKNRKLFVHTKKHDDVIELTSYKYSMEDENGYDLILEGRGLFKKINKKFRLQYITAKTDGFAPVSVTGSFSDYLDGGEFEGDLTYDNNAEQITGKFSVVDTRYQKFHVEKADFTADKKNMKITAEGTFHKEKFNCNLEAENNFRHNKIHIYNMNLFLDKYYIKGKPNSKRKPTIKPSDIQRKMKNTDITIDSWNIELNKVIRGRIEFENIRLNGFVKNHIFTLENSKMNFAKGTMAANGIFDLRKRSAELDFNAKNIDSAIISDVVLEIPNQVEGTASADIHVKTFHNLDKILAHIDFKIENGSLPQLGDREFYFRKSTSKEPWKVSLQKIVNVDVTKEVFTSDIEGCFDLDNYDLKNIILTSKQKYLAFIIRGNYGIETKQIDLKLFGKFNKAKEKGIRIFHIPMSWLVRIVLRPDKTNKSYDTELREVPQIQAAPDETENFRVKVQGNLSNTDDLNVELKRIVKE
ncbi:hypothetical protein IKQ26_04960 [bacterium]|nr:hypothetical protein [bacterium]